MQNWHVYCASSDSVSSEDSVYTLEMCMTGLDREKASVFFKEQTGFGLGSDCISESEEIAIVWSEESEVAGSLFLIRSMNMSVTGSSMIVWGDGVDGSCVSSGKAHAFEIIRVIEVSVENIESEE
ncbi:hypothetical protein KIW84_030943 [Lathyrus oleraceus]|uniref:Uncharacterized protein n=1 Tax=Pisum sativum TaxID=3888 RepID=A0A9D4XTQ9_PEA|nr:hypothetical protein KIW84_030943 [Pisum sativum]